VYKDAKAEPVNEEQLETAILELRRLRHFQESKPQGTHESHATIPESELPEMTSEYLSGFGKNIDSLDSLKRHMKHNLEHEAIHHFEDKKRAELVEKLIEETPFQIPALLVEHEIDTMIRQYEHELSQSGISLDDYLSFTQKTRESLRDDVRTGAEKRAKTQLIIDKLADQESIKPDDSKIQTELTEMNQQYGERTDFDESNAKSYLEQIYTNQAVFRHLEKLGGFVSHNHEEWTSKSLEE
jgi:FKBP-type peptidyl-prolyl cis-trans isomerase (trigger factor)